MSGEASELPVLGYWDLRGRAEHIRYLLSYAGAKYIDKRYALSSADEWFKADKHKLGLDFPNLPYYVEDDVKLTQSMAIMRYLGRKHKLAGESEEEQLAIDLLQEQLTDARSALRAVCASENFEDAKKTYLNSTLPGQLELFEKFIASKGNEFAVGERVTYIDFYAYEVLDAMRAFAPEVFAKKEKLMAYLTRFENLPAIKKHMSSKSFISTKNKRFAPFLKWGYSESE